MLSSVTNFQYWLMAILLGTLTAIAGLNFWQDHKPEPEKYIGIPPGICQRQPWRCGK